MSGLWIFVRVREKNFINLENFEKKNGYLSTSSSRDRGKKSKDTLADYRECKSRGNAI